jgi:hypothetical protein
MNPFIIKIESSRRKNKRFRVILSNGDKYYGVIHLIYNTLLNNIATKGSLSNNNIWTGTQGLNNDIIFNNNINGISPATFSYISNLTSFAQTLINNINNNLNNYQPLSLLYDTVLTLDSNEMLTSGAVFNAINNYQASFTYDTTPFLTSIKLIHF